MRIRWARFNAGDTNRDGVLSEDKYVAELERRLKQQYAAQGRQVDDFYRNGLHQGHVRFALLDRNHNRWKQAGPAARPATSAS